MYIYIYIYIFYTNTVICLCQTLSLAATSHTDNGIGSDWPAQNRRDVFYSLFNRRCRREEKKKRKKKNHRVRLLWCAAFVCSCAALSIYTVLYSASPKRLVLWHCTSIYLSIYPFIYPSTNSFLVETQAPIASLASVNPFHNLST